MSSSWVSNKAFLLTDHKTENRFQKYAPSHEKNAKNEQNLPIFAKWSFLWGFLHFSHDSVYIFENGFQLCDQWVKTLHLTPMNSVVGSAFKTRIRIRPKIRCGSGSGSDYSPLDRARNSDDFTFLKFENPFTGSKVISNQSWILFCQKVLFYCPIPSSEIKVTSANGSTRPKIRFLGPKFGPNDPKNS